MAGTKARPPGRDGGPMKLVIQRVSEASVTVDDRIVGSIGRGLLVFLCVERDDDEKIAGHYAHKVAGLRIFPDDAGKMNRSVIDAQGEILLVSQFTLAGDVEKGMRPSFVNAAPPDEADRLYLYFAEKLKQEGISVATGVFRAFMKVALVNDGPVTIIMGKLT
jgi:D-tyrosyl-tRNA(Tyr) deacylase